MTAIHDREALSRLVVYPQNAHFVRTGEGDIYPVDKVKNQIQGWVKRHTKTTMGLGIVFALAIVSFFLCLGTMLVSVSLLPSSPTSSQRQKSQAELTLNSICLGGLGLMFLLLGISSSAEFYSIYKLDRDPEGQFLKRLRNSDLIPAKVTAINPAPNGLTELIYEFDRVAEVEHNGEYRKVNQHYTVGSQILPSKIYEKGDEIVLLYYDDHLLVIL